MTDQVTWSDMLRHIEDVCPWAGPRPQSDVLDGKRPHRFQQRLSDLKQLWSLINSPDVGLITLAGDSGTGKTSLLNMGLRPALRRNGRYPFVVNSYEMLTGSADAFVFDYLSSSEPNSRRVQLPQVVIQAVKDEGRDFLAVMEEGYGDKAVLIFDQFEELIRRSERGFGVLVDWIVEARRTCSFPIIVSLRTEYFGHLRGLTQRVQAGSTRSYELPMLRDKEFIEGIVTSARDDGLDVTDDAVAILMDRFAPLTREGGGQTKYPLLAVQACLYTLFFRTHRETSGARVIDADAVETFLAEADQGGSNLWQWCFNQVIEQKLSHCRAAAEASSDYVPPTLLKMAETWVMDIAPQLSSGGYKLERGVGELFSSIASSRLGLRDNTIWESASDMIEKLLSGDHRSQETDGDDFSLSHIMFDKQLWERAAGACGLASPAAPESAEREVAKASGIARLPWLDDPEGVSAGALLGHPPIDVLSEEIRAYVTAMVWLRDAHLVRLSSMWRTADDAGEDNRAQVFATLVHDGFGEALNKWADSERATSRRHLHSIRSSRGESVTLKLVRPPAADGVRVFPNLNWPSCIVAGVKFERTVFLSCDFHGAAFLDCVFEGVTFVNCLLDGAIFLRCTIKGQVELGDVRGQDRAWTDFAPDITSFSTSYCRLRDGRSSPAAFAGVDELVREIAWYGGEALSESDARAKSLVSWAPGLQAVVADIPEAAGQLAAWPRDPTDTSAGPDGTSRVAPWVPQVGGLALFGGKLSALTFKKTDMEEAGSLALCLVSGSSLDFIEHTGGTIEIIDSAIRGLAITAPQGEAQPAEPGLELDLHVRGSVLFSTFFSPGLTGRALIEDSTVVGISNISDRAGGLRVTARHCQVAGPDHVLLDESEELEVEDSATGTRAATNLDDPEFMAKPPRVVYRSVPAQPFLDDLLKAAGRA
jgi:hypothetical protein